MKVRRSPAVNYYLFLVLDDQRKVLINKPFTSKVNQDSKKVIESISDDTKKAAGDCSRLPFLMVSLLVSIQKRLFCKTAFIYGTVPPG